MPDWNPAEIIGTAPRPLAVSLYRYLITDAVWREARAEMGYRHPSDEKLMVIIGGRPYIDVRNSFNSFLPADLPDAIGEVIVNASLARLDAHPELHDKIEFDICHTVLHFGFEDTFREWYPDLLSPKDLEVFRSSLRALTAKAVDLSPNGSLSLAIGDVQSLERRQARGSNLEPGADGAAILIEVKRLLEECVRFGTRPFSMIARHAFIAESLLRSAAQRGVLSSEWLERFKRSLATVSTEMSREFRGATRSAAARNQFLRRFGHLRPGTYDILSLRYDQRPDLFDNCRVPAEAADHGECEVAPELRRGLDELLREVGLDRCDADTLLEYARRAIVWREEAKFVFTRSLSDALVLIEAWGKDIDLTRDDLSHPSVSAILDTLHNPPLEDPSAFFRGLAELGRWSVEVTRSFYLSYLIRDTRDLHVIPLHRGAPNFVTRTRIEGMTIQIDSRMTSVPPLDGLIVCIENADPGFDWIFTRGLRGLVTKFGGSNSHMAVRCAEFGLPAAIGCGEQTFDRIVAAGKVELNCADRIVRPVYG